MAHFTADFTAFFTELAANNDRDWFHANKKRYEQSVKEPFKAFVTDVIAAVARHDPEVAIEAKDAIFRINRDTRFSKDKSPYKLNTAAVVSKHGRKDHQYPGLYLSMGADHLSVGGGCYMPGKEELWRIRDSIMSDPKAFRKAISGQDFHGYFGALQGEENKVLPKEFKAAAVDEPLIFRKQFYYMSNDDPAMITAPDLLDQVMARFQAARPFQQWLIAAIVD